MLGACDPLVAAANAAQRHDSYVLLHTPPHAGDGASYLAFDAVATCSEWPELERRLAHDGGRWFGYLGYDGPASGTSSRVASRFPPSWMTRFRHVLRICGGRVESLTGVPPPSWLNAPAPAGEGSAAAVALRTNMDGVSYRAAVREAIAHIRAGNFYQVNLTRKLMGRLDAAPQPLALFHALCKASPARYAAILQLAPGRAVLSSSMERFIAVDASGNVSAQPIKGTAPRGMDADDDARQRVMLSGDPKERAENLMIVDLMRNDLSRNCVPGSVRVPSLCTVSSHPALHHLVSTVTGTLRRDRTTLQLLQGAFPPGSMTGAPKRAAMAWIAGSEPHARGIYSGALGWIDGDGACDFSVVIRTLLLDSLEFEFQVGSGIVAESDPEREWEETLVKALGIAHALGISGAMLRGAELEKR